MYLEIVSPEAVLFSNEVDSVVVPGVNGEFQMLNDHAAVVSSLAKGSVKVHVHSQSITGSLNEKIVPSKGDSKILTLNINSGSLEMKNNKAIILVD